MSPRLALSLKNSPDDTKAASTLWFQEEGKKSAFALDLNGVSAIEQPAHAVIQCFETTSSVPFLFGGLELVSNSRNVEVYTSDDNGKESYMKTCRGIVYNTDDDESTEATPQQEWFKCVIVSNGGPRSVSRVNLKLLSLKPAKCTRATLKLVKLKGRLPDAPQSAAASTTSQPAATGTRIMSTPAASAAPPPPQQQQQQQQAPPLSQEDIGSAMAAMSMMVRVTEERVVKNTNAGLQRVETAIGQGFTGFQHSLTELCSVVVSQRTALQQQGQLLSQQQEMIQSQNLVLEEMQKSQTELTGMTQTLKKELELLRSEMRDRPGETNGNYIDNRENDDGNEDNTIEAALSLPCSVVQTIEDVPNTEDASVSPVEDCHADEPEPDRKADDDNGEGSTVRQVEPSKSEEAIEAKDRIDNDKAESGNPETRQNTATNDGGEGTTLTLDDTEKLRREEEQETNLSLDESSSSPLEEDGGNKDQVQVQVENHPHADSQHTGNVEADISETRAQDLDPACVSDDETSDNETKPVPAMNPVPDEHWSVAEGDLLGLDEDISGG